MLYKFIDKLPPLYKEYYVFYSDTHLIDRRWIELHYSFIRMSKDKILYFCGNVKEGELSLEQYINKNYCWILAHDNLNINIEWIG